MSNTDNFGELKKTEKIVYNKLTTHKTYSPEDYPTEDHFTAAWIAAHIHENFVLKSHLQTQVERAEKRILDLAQKPCECRRDHLATPVRSVTGVLTTYCQFSRIVRTEATLTNNRPGEGETDASA